MNFEQMSEALQQSIIKAVELCKEKNHPMIDTIHMLKVLFEQDTLDGLFKRLNIDKKLALRMIDEDLRNVVSSSGGEPRFSNELIQSFEKAIEHNYAIELDVQLTKDNELVVFHDDNLERLTGDTRDVKDVEYKELKSLKLENTQETIPTLKEVIGTLSKMTGRDLSKEQEEKIINAVVNDKVPKNLDEYYK